MIITIPESGFVPIEYFKDFLDISKILFYSLEEKDGTLVLKFYDKNRKLLKLKESKNDKKESCKKVSKGCKKVSKQD